MTIALNLDSATQGATKIKLIHKVVHIGALGITGWKFKYHKETYIPFHVGGLLS